MPDRTTTAYAPFSTSIGTVYVAWRDQAVRFVNVASSPDAFVISFIDRFGEPARPAADLPDRLARQIQNHLRGQPRFAGPVDLADLSPFQRRAVELLREIPHGEVRPYSWLADQLGAPGAARAVGTAMARNPIPLLLPCHRVVRRSGEIGPYGMGGPEIKRRLLAAEGVDLAELARLARLGLRFRASQATGLFCLPTCHGGSDEDPAAPVYLRSSAEALVAGYRPCQLCRPAMVVNPTNIPSASS